MADLNPTAEWDLLGDVYYRRRVLFTMEWGENDIDLTRFIVAGAPFGGPIALVRDDKKIVRVKSGNLKPLIYIFTASGRIISTIKWDSGGSVVQLGWSHTEELIIVVEGGTVLYYDIHGQFIRSQSLGEEVKASKILDAKIFRTRGGTAIAVLTTAYRFFIIQDRPKRMADVPGIDCPPSSWTVIPDERGIKILVALGNDLYLVDGGQAKHRTPPGDRLPDAYTEMAVSFDFRLLAMFGSNGILWVGTADLNQVFCEVNTDANQRPLQLAWCGGGAIICHWEHQLFMIGPNRDYINFTVDGEASLVAEPDGLRVISNFNHDFIQRIPEAVENVFLIGSSEPGAVLFDAFKEFERKSAKADEYIRILRDNRTLEKAVEQCIAAAGSELEPSYQRHLLRASSFGKCFLDDFNSQSFVEMCHVLRVLNAVRDFRIAIPLTIIQYQKLSLPILIDRLILRRHYALAMRICKYMNISEMEGESRVLAHWACYKVEQRNIDDRELAAQISKKLGDARGISYTDIAEKATECGRRNLAIELLNFEPKAEKQVPVLIKMNELNYALQKAIESGDTELVYAVILRLKDNMPRHQFLMTIQQSYIAFNLYLQMCRAGNKEELKDLYEMADRKAEKASVCVELSLESSNVAAKREHLEDAKELYTFSKRSFEAKATEDEIKLLEHQKMLEEKLGVKYVGLSLFDTMHRLLIRGSPFVDKLKSQFKVSDKRFWWLRIRALAAAKKYEELMTFAKSKKSPIGYEPFFQVVYDNGQGNVQAAKNFIGLLPPEGRIRSYLVMRDFLQAAREAQQARDVERLDHVLGRATNPSDQRAIAAMKADLLSKRK
ncbi:vacuolar protein sorting-associated protein 16 homolog [Oscarella lobularis]|uniref:vacuolar protein sorting-associated protein 16 homolog n=1 Tax=Oscarella lobularis TaxID=121494 RepID=UPI003313A706